MRGWDDKNFIGLQPTVVILRNLDVVYGHNPQLQTIIRYQVYQLYKLLVNAIL